MKTFEGTMTIMWHKNDRGDRRALTIDCEDRKALNSQLKEIKNKFLSEGDDPSYPRYREGIPYDVKFDMSERK